MYAKHLLISMLMMIAATTYYLLYTKHCEHFMCTISFNAPQKLKEVGKKKKQLNEVGTISPTCANE